MDNSDELLRHALMRIEAIEDTLGAITMAAMRQMPHDKRTGFTEAIAALAASAEAEGDIASATLLTHLHAAAVHGSS